ncbi:MAG: hypothetical protein HN390_09245 [Anaerolineae bacterium]|nr:hypothetical protein [Anaerolineae bacterium]MBT7990983.1 hypothetical protein [Anaerolineae bacterium]
MNSSYSPMSKENVERYLNFLSAKRQEPSIQALSKLIEAHLFNIPFENISKLYYKDVRILPNQGEFLEGIESFHFGGTCYTNNYYFSKLLNNLGYNIKLCGADMSNPDVHIVSMVTLGKREYLVDVGYAAPFWMPIPVDLDTDYTIHFGQDQYVLKPRDAARSSKMELYRDGKLKHGYLAKSVPRQIQEFEHVIIDSFREEGTFMNALLLAKFSPKQSFIIHNLTATKYQDDESNTRKLESKNELVQVVYEWFKIPKECTINALNQLDLTQDAWN